MLLNFRSFVLSIFAITMIANPIAADTWKVDPETSSLGFEVSQGDSVLKGNFTTWQADIEFDPDAPETAKISAEIQPVSATTGNAQFDGTLPGADWFNTEVFPAATFTSDKVSLVEGNSYRATGSLTIKGLSHPVELDFTLEIEGDTAIAKGTAKMSRLDYDLGKGVGADTVGDIVTVSLNLAATR